MNFFPTTKGSGGAATDNYKIVSLASGASTPSIHMKVGECMCSRPSYGYLAYTKNGGSMQTYAANTDQRLITCGDFLWVLGHAYCGVFVCKSEGDYVFRNDTGTTANVGVPDR